MNNEFNRMETLFHDSNIWKLVYHNTGLPFQKWPSGNWAEIKPKIFRLRKTAYEQGYVEKDGYTLTLLGKNLVLLLDQHL